MKLLIVEDDARLSDVLARGLSEQGHVIDQSHDGEDGERCALAGAYDAIILDIQLPKKDGLSVIRTLRTAGVATPVLILTSRDTAADIIEGLDAGADDYLRKPFIFGELEARLRSIVRRELVPVSNHLQFEDIRFDLASRRVFRGDREIVLTARETAFLEYFMHNPGRIVTRRMLEDALWDRENESSSNVIEVYIRRLRSKLSIAPESALIHTVRGAGYRFGSQP
ncbi:MAG: response regulator transcription factor [Candidatus Eremiobacteraeota bacterium]|nr:response regulator transcription factor [Candidatus Eremiobacteraeota bacterium]